MKVLHVIDYYGPHGGLHQFLLRLRSVLAPKGIEQIYLAREKTPFQVTQEEVDFEVQVLGDGSFPGFLEQVRPDLVHFHEYLPYVDLQYCVEKYPTAITLHDHSLFCPTSFFAGELACPGVMTRACVQAGCISNEELASKREYQELYKHVYLSYFAASIEEKLLENGFCKKYLQKIPTLIPVAPKVAEPKENLLVFAGRLVPQKGLAFLLESLARVEEKNWRLIVAGSGDREYANQMVRLCIQLDLLDRVEFYGHLERAELEEIFCQARLFVFPSVGSEGYGFSGAEALTYGVPVVAFDVGGVSEWLEDGYNGYIVPVADVEKMSSAIGQLLRDDQLYHRFRENALKRCQERSLEAEVGMIEDFYQRVLDQFRTGRS